MERFLVGQWEYLKNLLQFDSDSAPLPNCSRNKRPGQENTGYEKAGTTGPETT
jgi:hypothetical protein